MFSNALTVRQFKLALAAAALIMALLLAACREQDDPPGAGDPTARATTIAGQPIQPSPTPTITLTPAPSNTPTPTLTPTITPTPTATAPRASVSGNPLAAAVHDAAPQAGAPCGVIDLLDFPLDPPDALNIARGGQDFNVFRNRYDGYHAGEDWWGPGGRGGSFGEPVYSIGHGQVTFAHPYGWGIDQGTVILRHVFPNGAEFYSFYGHLDPPSIELRYGQCVSRGQQVGAIGRPRGSPHLHFELRTHTPSDPGPGYWSHDPRRSGWLAPSHTIWNWRIGVSPGVLWQRSDLRAGLQPLSPLQPDTLAVVDGPDIVGYRLGDGSQRWRVSTAADPELDEEFLAPISATAFDAQQPILYSADRRGRIAAYRLPPQEGEASEEAAPLMLWDLQLHNLRGAPTLIPLPSGGVALAVQGRMIAFTPAGALLWRKAFDVRPLSWQPWQEATFVSATGDGDRLWQVSAEGLLSWPTELSGKLVQAASALYLYDGDAVYRLNSQTQSADLFFELPDGLASQGDMIALPDGGLLLAHRDGGGRRLIALDPSGVMRWQRAYDGQFDGKPRLLLSGNQPYIFSEEENGAWSRVTLHRIDMQSEQLTLVFSGGTRTPIPGGSWLLATAAGQFLINIGGGSLLALDAGAALQVVCGGSASPGC